MEVVSSPKEGSQQSLPHLAIFTNQNTSENVASVLWQSSHSTEWILSRRHLSVAALPTTSSYLGRPDCPDCDRCRSRVEIWSNCKTTLSLFIQGDIFTAPQAPIQYVVNVARRILSMQTWFKMATKMCHQYSPVPHMFQILLGSNHCQF